MIRTKTAAGAVLGMGALVLLGAWLARGPEETRPRPTRAALIPVVEQEPEVGWVIEEPKAEAGSPPASVPSPDEPVAQESFWVSLDLLFDEREEMDPAAYRAEVVRRTAAHLGVGAGFVAASSRAVSAINAAWTNRTREMEARMPWGIDEEREQEIHDRYVRAKSAALEDVEAFLDDRPGHVRFRDELGTWVDYLRQEEQP